MNKHEIKYEQTTKKICDALIELLKEKRIEEIFITELCIVADVNRSTFYSRFETVSDVLDETRRQIRKMCFEEINETGIVNMEKTEGGKLTKEDFKNKYLRPFLNIIYNHRDIFAIKEFSKSAEMFSEDKKSFFFNIFIPSIDESLADNEMKYLFVFYFSGIDAVINRWINTGCRCSIEQMCDIITKCISYEFD